MTPEKIEAALAAFFGNGGHLNPADREPAMRAALIAAEPLAWSRDMTKAPKKKHLDLWDGEKRRTDCFWSVDRWYQLVIGFGIEVKATHWRLPPAPPEAG